MYIQAWVLSMGRFEKQSPSGAHISAGALEQILMFCVCWTYRRPLFAANSRRRHAGPASHDPIVAWQRLLSQS